jgi:hypothetical protein
MKVLYLYKSFLANRLKAFYSPQRNMEEPKHSLNFIIRKKELIKQVIDNQALLKRLNGQRSSYNTKKQIRERYKVE